LRCSAVGWVAYEIQQFFKQLFQQAFEPSRKRKGTDHFAPEEPISPKKAKSKQKSLATKAKSKRQTIEFSKPDWKTMFVKHGPPTKEELPIRCSLFANKQEGWQSGTILEECDECGNPDDSEDEAEGVNGGHFKIKFDDGDQGVLEFPDATCLLHGNNVCIQAMSKGVKLHSRVAVESDNDSYQVGQLLGANLDGSRVSVHLDANEQWMDASQVFALIAPAEGDTFDNPPGAVVLPSKKREREKTATNDTKSKKKSATDNKSVAPPPKKAKSSYIIFSCEMRSTVKDEMPEASMGEISKVLGARWQDLAASEKKIYEDKQGRRGQDSSRERKEGLRR